MLARFTTHVIFTSYATLHSEHLGTANELQALTWGLITGFKSPFPWFYAAFFVPMIIHRAYRDLQRCSEKYGEDWEEYKRRVPYLFIPVSSTSYEVYSEGLHLLVCILIPRLYIYII